MFDKELKNTFNYNPLTGQFFRLSNLVECKCKGKRGYYIVSFKNKRYYIHRLIWIMNNGNILDNFVIDHKNRNRTDNRLNNLRCIPKNKNNQNVSVRKTNKSGYRGIMWNKATKSWRVRIMNKHIGLFKDLESAINARKQAELIYFS